MYNTTVGGVCSDVWVVCSDAWGAVQYGMKETGVLRTLVPSLDYTLTPLSGPSALHCPLRGFSCFSLIVFSEMLRGLVMKNFFARMRLKLYIKWFTTRSEHSLVLQGVEQSLVLQAVEQSLASQAREQPLVLQASEQPLVLKL